MLGSAGAAYIACSVMKVPFCARCLHRSPEFFLLYSEDTVLCSFSPTSIRRSTNLGVNSYHEVSQSTPECQLVTPLIKQLPLLSYIFGTSYTYPKVLLPPCRFHHLSQTSPTATRSGQSDQTSAHKCPRRARHDRTPAPPRPV
jgi:hypothetical protein